MSASAVVSTSGNPLDLYEPLEIIGNGSFGIIRKVRRKSDSVILARKELNFERMSERDRKQIVAEVNILKDLHHENIVRYIDRFVDRDAGILYIIMEYCDGGDLASVIKQCSRNNRLLPEDTIWAYFFQLLQSLQHCHCPGENGDGSKRQQILHRDLKPENVFIHGNNTLKLGDFGLSKALSQTSFANTYVGTPYYMSPELIQEKAYDTKSDIWSLGCLIYELCALKPPFHEAQTHSELSKLISTGRIPPLPKGYSHSLSQLIKLMLNVNPSMRPSTQQLLQHDRLEFARKVSETEKLLSAVKIHKMNLTAKEKDLQLLSDTLAQREASMAMVLQQKDHEIQNLSVLLSQADVRAREAVAVREAELREAVMRREEEVRLALVKRDEEIRDAVNKRQEEINDAWRNREDELRAELRDAVEWVERRQKELMDEAETLEKARADLAKEAERLSDLKVLRKEKTPFEEVKNLLAPVSQQALGRTPKKASLEDALATIGLETPVLSKQEDFLHIPQATPGSAMRGIVLTSTGQALQTPMPSSRIAGSGLELGKIIKQSPAVGLNFRKIFDFEEESETEDEAEGDAEDDTGRQTSDEADETLTISAKLASGEAEPSIGSPTVDVEKRKSVLNAVSARCSRPRSQTIDRSRPVSANGTASDSISQGPPSRLRRPSIRSARRIRTNLPQSSSCPNIFPDAESSIQTPSRAQTLPTSNRAATTTATGAKLTTQGAIATPRYNAEDEENLPSPFLRRVERERLAATNTRIGVAITGTAAPGSTILNGGRRKSNGNMLRAIAAANSANNIAGVSPSPSIVPNDGMSTATSLVGVKSS